MVHFVILMFSRILCFSWTCAQSSRRHCLIKPQHFISPGRKVYYFIPKQHGELPGRSREESCRNGSSRGSAAAVGRSQPQAELPLQLRRSYATTGQDGLQPTAVSPTYSSDISPVSPSRAWSPRAKQAPRPSFSTRNAGIEAQVWKPSFCFK